MNDHDRLSILAYLVTPRLAHAMLAEERGDAVVWMEQLSGIPEKLDQDVALFDIGYQDGSGQERFLVEVMIKSNFIEPESPHPDWKGFYRATKEGKAFVAFRTSKSFAPF